MKRLLLAAILIPRAAWATGILNVLLGTGALLVATASPPSITYTFPSATLISSSATCAGRGGAPPYTYGWSWASGGASISINAASSATTNFTVSGAAVNTTYSGVAQCVVTDSRSIASPHSNGVTVTLTRIPLFPPSVGSATLVAGMVSGGGQNVYGYVNAGSVGTLSPTMDYNSNTVQALYWSGGVSMVGLVLVVSQPSSNSGYIAELSINGTLYATSSATYSYTSPNGSWTWSSAGNPFTPTSSYPVLYY